RISSKTKSGSGTGNSTTDDQDFSVCHLSLQIRGLIFPADLEHSLNGTQRATANVFIDEDLKLLFLKRLERVFKRDLIHVRATDATKSQHLFVRIRRGDVIA